MTVPSWVPLGQVSPFGKGCQQAQDSFGVEGVGSAIWQTQDSFLEEASSSNPRRDRVAKNGLRRGSRIRQGPEVRRGNDCFI